MASTYVNDLRLEEMATGDQSGTWGDTTNTNLELIAEAFSYGTEASFGSDADATTTIADGASDPARSLYLKVTSGVDLTATRTLTIAPNTVSKIWIIENATSGSQSINISQGSGANVTIPSGDVKVIYTDGAGSGAAVVDAFTDLNTSGTLTATNLAGTLTTAAQPNITSVGTLTGFTSTGIDDNATSTAITIDSSENVGIGTASPAALLDVAGNFIFKSPANTLYGNFDNTTAGYGAFRLQNQGSNYGFIGQTSSILASGGSNTALGLRSENEFAIATGGSTEKMRIDSSGNVGIGTTSPSSFYSGARQLVVGSGSGEQGITVYGGNAATSYLLFADGTSGAELYAGQVNYNHANNSLNFNTNGITTPRMTIDSSGSVGIGTTSPTEKLDVNGGTVIKGSLTNGSGTGSALRMQHSSNISEILSLEPGVAWRELRTNASQQTFYIAGGEKMRIDSSGNVGIGTADPDYNLVVGDAGVTANAYIEIGTTTTGAGNLFFGDTSGTGVGSYSGYVQYDHNTDSMILGTASTERMRIDSSGNVGIGATPNFSEGSGLEIERAGVTTLRLQNTTSGKSAEIKIDTNLILETINSGSPIQFNTGAVERMRIDSSGNLLVGTTTLADVNNIITNHLFEGANSTAGNAAVGVYNSTGTANCPAFNVLNRDASTDTTNRFVQFYANVTSSGATAMGGIVGNGASNVQFATLSDEREKENITPVNNVLDKLMNLNVVSFDWKKNDEHVKAGFIAQNVEEHFPEYVIENIANDGEEPRKGTTGGMSAGYIAVLTKAIQEQQTQIEALQSEINLLKGE